MRLDKFLSKATELSRKDAKKFFMLVKLLSMAPSSKTQVIMLIWQMMRYFGQVKHYRLLMAIDIFCCISLMVLNAP